MKITFLGATHEVTGSCTLLQANGKNILVDCGMEQGRDIFENFDIPVNAGEIDCVLITHAHIDHTGKVPILCKNGFRGKIYATRETVNLCKIMLMDSAHIQEFEAEWRNRKAKRKGSPPVEPMYTTDDVQCTLKKMHPCEYGEKMQVLDNVVVRFNDAGHLLGSANIEIWITENGITKKILFSGDVGNTDRPILKNPTTIDETDYLVIESTYGDRLHEKAVNPIPILTDCIQRTLDRGGNVVIPSFAVGRTQELLYLIRKIKLEGLVKGHDGFPVYMDSPLANEATAVFLQSDHSCYDSDTLGLIDDGINPLVFPNLEMALTSEESKAINFDKRPKVIISASGMCEAGRIRHHLKHNLWRDDSLILFVGYQANGSLGRAIVEGAKSVKMFGETISVNAEIEVMPGASGHADKQGLLDFVTALKNKPQMIFVNHGDNEVTDNFAKLLHEEYGYETYAPYSGTSYDLLTGEFIDQPDGVLVKKEEKQRPTDERAQKAHDKLIAAAENLMRTANSSKGISNKEIYKLADQIDQLSEKLRRKR